MAITTREELLQETIERTKASAMGSPNLRKWEDTPDLYIKLHPKYKGELENDKEFYPATLKEIPRDKNLKTKVKEEKILNDIFKTNIFKKNTQIETNLSFKSYDGMPVGAFKIRHLETNKTFELDTYNKSKEIEAIIQAISTDSKFLEKITKKYQTNLSEKYAYKIWNNYSQSYTFYKMIDMGTKMEFEGFKNMEELEKSIKKNIFKKQTTKINNKIA